MKIVAIIPAYNEEESVGEIVKKTKEYVNDVIVIDDGSTDRTAEIAEKAGAIVYSHSRNRGLGLTIIDGYSLALKQNADIILQIDADGQYLPEEIPKLLKPINDKKADIVLGSRFAGEIEEMSLTKKIGNRLFSKITSFLSGTKITDAQTGFRAMRKEVADSIIPIGKYTYTQEMIIRSLKEGYQVLEVPIFFAKRKYGKSRLIRNIFSYGLLAFSIVIKTFRDYHPLIFFGVPGLILLLIGFLLGGYILSLYLAVKSLSEHTGIIVLTALLIMFGSFMVFVGMLAEMIQSRYLQIREHIKRIFKFNHTK